MVCATIGGVAWGVLGALFLGSAGQVTVAIAVPFITTSGAVLTAYFTTRDRRDRPTYEDLEEENERLRRKIDDAS